MRITEIKNTQMRPVRYMKPAGTWGDYGFTLLLYFKVTAEDGSEYRCRRGVQVYSLDRWERVEPEEYEMFNIPADASEAWYMWSSYRELAEMAAAEFVEYYTGRDVEELERAISEQGLVVCDPEWLMEDVRNEWKIQRDYKAEEPEVYIDGIRAAA